MIVQINRRDTGSPHSFTETIEATKVDWGDGVLSLKVSDTKWTNYPLNRINWFSSDTAERAQCSKD